MLKNKRGAQPGKLDTHRPSPRPASATQQKTINLALQGGRAHAAFAWGILDRLLEDERINIEGIRATSAGGMNGACVAYGMAIGGRQAARTALSAFWGRVSDAARWSPLQPSWYDRLTRYSRGFSLLVSSSIRAACPGGSSRTAPCRAAW